MTNAVLVLYIGAAACAGGSAIWHSFTIADNKPILHGRWLAIWLTVMGAGAALVLRNWWALLALLGMLGFFSACFRTFLNEYRGKPFSYMGPEPIGAQQSFLEAWGNDFKGRSWYDLICWTIAKRLRCLPVVVALCLEGLAAAGAYVLIP